MKAAILYLPVVHAGHLDFSLRQKPDSLYVLGTSLISELPFLERDVRRLKPELAVKEAQAVALAPQVLILEKSNLSELDKFDELVLSHDDVGRELEERYLKGKKIVKDTTFLRWHSMNAITKMPVQEDATVSSAEFDRKMMDLAQSEAEKSSDWWRHVGAVLAKDGKVIATAYNKHAITENTHYIDGEPRSNFLAGPAIADLVIFAHGEATMIARAARSGISTEGAEIYVTVFPCPSCAMAIANAGIKKVYYREGYSLLDAERILKQAGAELIRII
jgi:dCMP deaminase